VRLDVRVGHHARPPDLLTDGLDHDIGWAAAKVAGDAPVQTRVVLGRHGNAPRLVHVCLLELL
jgi:hypothetical protein